MVTEFIPKTPPIWQTQLAFELDPTDMTATIATELLIGGASLSGLVAVSIDIGQPNPEYAIGNLSGNTLTFTLRNIDPLDPTISLGTFASIHRQGAVVKITDFATIQIMRNILSGIQPLQNPLISNSPAVNPTDVPNFSQLQGAVISGGLPASTSVMGLSRVSVSPNVTLGTPTITIASPAVVTLATHGLTANDIIFFTTTGSLPTGITASTNYYVLATGLTTNTFEISATPAGIAINTSGTQSGTHTLVKATPIAVETLDPRVPTANQTIALGGDNTDIPVGAGNKTVTQTGLQKGAEVYGATATGNDSYIITLVPAPISYTDGMHLFFKADVGNTGSSTLNVNGLGAISLVTAAGTLTVTGDILASQIVEVIYNSTSPVFQIVNPASAVLINPSTTVFNATVNTSPTSNTTYTYVAQLVPTSATAMSGWATSSPAVSQASVGVTQLGANVSNGSYNTSVEDGLGNSYVPNDGKTLSIKFRVQFLSSAGITGFGMALQATPATFYAAETDVVAGFRFVNNGGTLFAQNANGTTKTSTNISGSLTLTNYNTYEIVFTPGVSALFYANGVLVATQTTNLPTTQTLNLGYGCSTNSNLVRSYSPIITIQT